MFRGHYRLIDCDEITKFHILGPIISHIGLKFEFLFIANYENSLNHFFLDKRKFKAVLFHKKEKFLGVAFEKFQNSYFLSTLRYKVNKSYPDYPERKYFHQKLVFILCNLNK